MKEIGDNQQHFQEMSSDVTTLSQTFLKGLKKK
jgi:hypothetical protein